MGTLASLIVLLIRNVPVVSALFNEILALFMAAQTKETLSSIQDAAALSMKAQNDEERYQAASSWRVALNRYRMQK